MCAQNILKNILLINYGGIGDEILFLPVISSLKKDFPNCKLTLCLEPRSRAIKDLCPLIDDVICADIKAKGLKKYINIIKMLIEVRKHHFDTVISSGKSPLVAILLFLTGIKKRVGYKSKTDFLLTDAVELNENQYASNMYHDLISPVSSQKCGLPKILAQNDFILPQNLKDGEFVAIHPGVSKMSVSKNILKCPDLNFWKKLIAGILEKGEKVAVLGGPDDKEIIEKIFCDENFNKNADLVNLYGKTKNISDMKNIIAKAKSLICVDSAPMHVGVALNKKVFAIFGPTNEKKLIPQKENFYVITANTECRPCLWHKRAYNCEHSICLQIDPQKILNLI